MFTTTTRRVKAPDRAAALPSGFDPRQHPILAKHWFGVEPHPEVRQTALDAPAELFDLWENTSLVGYLRTGLRNVWWQQSRVGNRLPAENGVVVSDGGKR